MAIADMTLTVKVEGAWDARSLCYGIVLGWCAGLLFALAVIG